VTALAVLADGRLTSGDEGGEVRLWDAAAGGDATAVRPASDEVSALVMLLDGRRLAVGVDAEGEGGCVEVWDVSATPPVRAESTDTGIPCGSAVSALAVLANGHLAVGDNHGKVRVVDVDAGGVSAVLNVFTDRHNVSALAVLPNGELAVGSKDGAVHVWDVGTKACIAVLGGHTGWVRLLAVLADGRLACGAGTGVVALWDVGARTCVGTLAGHSDDVSALAALPDGRIVTGSDRGVLQLWDTRPAATAAVATTCRATGTVPVSVLAHVTFLNNLLVPLSDGRIAVACGDDILLLEVPPPATYE